MIDQKRLVESFCRLVRIDSPSEEEEEVANYLQEHLTDIGFHVSRDLHGNLIASEDGESPILLSAHMDTVEPGRGIKPQVTGDVITSDGTTILGGDCKAGIAAILEGLQSVKDEGASRRPAQLVFTRGEEIGLVGAGHLDFSMIQAQEGVVFDGNGPVSKITSSSPTYIRFDVKVTGRAAHAGVEPEKGLSAIKIASEIITQLPQGRLDDETTFNIGTIVGGSVRNAVPEEASFTGEFRSRNVETLDLVKIQLTDTLQDARVKYSDAIIDQELSVSFRMYSLDHGSHMIQMASHLVKGLGLTPDIAPSGGGTDANVFLQHGLQCVVVGMATNEMHTTREFVRINELADTARFCHLLLTNTK